MPKLPAGGSRMSEAQSTPQPGELWQHRRFPAPTTVQIVSYEGGFVFFRSTQKFGGNIIRWSLEHFLGSFERCNDTELGA